MRETAAVKGLRLLIEGRLNITHRIGDDIVATVRGDSGEVYSVSHVRGAWSCNCPAFGRCSHLIALQRVAVIRGQWMPVDRAWPRLADAPLTVQECRRASVVKDAAAKQEVTA